MVVKKMLCFSMPHFHQFRLNAGSAVILISAEKLFCSSFDNDYEWEDLNSKVHWLYLFADRNCTEFKLVRLACISSL